MLKESRPVKDTMKEMVEKTDSAVRGKLSQGVRAVWRHIPRKLPYGPTSKENDRS